MVNFCKNPKPVLLLINQKYPLEPFLQDEYKILCNMEEVEISVFPTDMPASEPGYQADQLDLHLARTRLQKFVSAFKYIKLDLFDCLKEDLQSISWGRLVKFIHAYVSVSFYTERLREIILAKGYEHRPLMVYTYWFTPASYAAGLLKHEFPHLQVITRAHGIDLFSKRHKGGYIPLRKSMCNLPDLILPCSAAGQKELLTQGCKADKTRLAYLGVPPANGLSRASQGNKLCLVSCSTLAKVKRIPKLVESLAALAEKRSDLIIDWHHVGGSGKALEALKQYAFLRLGNIPYVTFTLHGQLPLAKSREIYQTMPVDIHVSTSSYEGVPVSMMEAGMAGVPVLGTNAGGVSELVTDKTGFLLDIDFSPSDFISGVEKLMRWRNEEKRKQVSQVFQSKFNAETNYQSFIDNAILPNLSKSAELLACCGHK